MGSREERLIFFGTGKDFEKGILTKIHYSSSIFTNPKEAFRDLGIYSLTFKICFSLSVKIPVSIKKLQGAVRQALTHC